MQCVTTKSLILILFTFIFFSNFKLGIGFATPRPHPVAKPQLNSKAQQKLRIRVILMAESAQDYSRGFGIIRHNIPKVAANNSFDILWNLTSDNKAIVFTKLLFVAGK